LYPEDYSAVLRVASKTRQTDLAGLEAERFAMNHRDLTVAMLSDWGLPKIFCDVVQAHEQCDETVFSRSSREYALVQSLALSRLIADICIADEAGRTAAMPRLFVLGARLSIENGDLIQLCDGVVAEWREWAAILNVAASPLPSFDQLASSTAEEEVPAKASGPSCLRVLVADADQEVRALARATLEQDGYEVVEAADGQEALRLALEVQPHALVIAGSLPQPDGLEVTRALRETRLGRGIYILMLTAHENGETLARGFEVGVDDYMAKPVEPRLLAARLRASRRIVHLHQEIEHDREELRRFAAELSISNRRLQEAALTDDLTGLPNRRHAMAHMEQEWAASVRNKRPLACMVIDLDQFKQVNDANGHDIGDAYLKQVASTIRSAVRSQDVVCRTGGDEFLVICPDTPLQAALACAERIRRAVEQAPVEVGGQRLKAGMSAGVAMREASMANVDALIKRADEGVYLAKQQGGNRIASPQS
jgi:diguanylate cyclase (GGDEF)-like protein